MFDRLSDFLRRRRLDLGLTMEELGERSGVSVSHISRIERGTQVPKVDTLGQFLKGLDLSFTAFARRYAALVEELDPEAFGDVEDVERIIEGVVAPLRPMLDTMPAGLNSVQLELPKFCIYIIPKPSNSSEGPSL